MKDIKISQIISGVALTALLVSGTTVYGQTIKKDSSPSAAMAKDASPSAAITQTEIQDLKEKIATKVAELRKKNQKALAGTITSIKDKSIFIKNNEDAEYEVKVDEALTKVYLIGTTKKEMKSTDLKKGSYIIATGPILDKTIDANYIYQDEQFTVLSGKITEINKDDFSIKVLTTDKDTYTLDIENSTNQQMMDIKTLELDKVGFSKLKEGDTIHFVIKKTGIEKENRYTATKIVIVPQEYFQK